MSDETGTSGHAIVTTTVAGAQAAEHLAGIILDAQLGACVQIHPVQSHYRWQGARHSEAEWLLTIKTRATLFHELASLIRNHHDYETPEIVMTPVIGTTAAYGAWLDAATADRP